MRGIMNTKLTLQIDDEVIRSAKEFAKNNHISLSKLAENYFRLLVNKDSVQKTNSPPGVVGELSGILKGKDVDFDKEDHIDYLENKYR